MSQYRMRDVEITTEIYYAVSENCNFNTSDRFPTKGKFDVIYGLDHACGWFVSLMPVDEIGKQEVAYILFPGAECIDFDTMFTGFTHSELGYILKLFNGNPVHIDKAYLDLAF